MLGPKSWLDAAKGLTEGHSARVDHDCGGGRTLYIRNEARRWYAHCFRCGDTGIVDKHVETVAQFLERRKREQESDTAISNSVQLPSPANYDIDAWPLDARVWLYKAGLGRPEIKQLGAYYHEGSGRVVVPVIDGSRIVYWQARALGWKRGDARAKYINPKVDRSRIVAKYGTGHPLVLTEDTLSAFRVGQHTTAWSLLGTKLPDPVALQVVQHGGPVLVWLDPDPPGRAGMRKIARQLNSYGVQARRVDSRADPKMLSDKEIRTFLWT